MATLNTLPASIVATNEGIEPIVLAALIWLEPGLPTTVSLAGRPDWLKGEIWNALHAGVDDGLISASGVTALTDFEVGEHQLTGGHVSTGPVTTDA